MLKPVGSHETDPFTEQDTGWYLIHEIAVRKLRSGLTEIQRVAQQWWIRGVARDILHDLDAGLHSTSDASCDEKLAAAEAWEREVLDALRYLMQNVEKQDAWDRAKRVCDSQPTDYDALDAALEAHGKRVLRLVLSSGAEDGLSESECDLLREIGQRIASLLGDATREVGR